MRHYQRWRKWGDPLKNPQTQEERFWAKVDQQPDSCWLWTGAMMDAGYGIFRFNGATTVAHRVALILVGRDIPEGFVVDHLCGTRLCVNPAHLEAVTMIENVRRGRRNGRVFGAAQRAKTHCPKGHAYDEQNTYLSKAGKRHCKQCGRDRDRETRTEVRGLRERIAELEAQLHQLAP